MLAALAGNTTGNIDVDQRDGTVYFCHQGDGTEGNKEVRVAVGRSLNLALPPTSYTTHVAAKGSNSIAALFPVCKVASDGTVYVAYSDGGTGIFVAHSTNQGTTWSVAGARERPAGRLERADAVDRDRRAPRQPGDRRTTAPT